MYRKLSPKSAARHVTAFAVLSLLGGQAVAQDPAAMPVTQALSQRFVLIVLDQPDRDLTKGDSKLNMMFDSQTGRSWILEFARKPNSNERGYVWVEVPYAKPPTN